jgi:hypothetical protein
VEDRLQLLVDEHNAASVQSGKQQYLSLKLNSKISNRMSWTVKKWHFGKDARISYSGEKFDMSWEDSLNVFHHIYSKEYGNKKINVRKEIRNIQTSRWNMRSWINHIIKVKRLVDFNCTFILLLSLK